MLNHGGKLRQYAQHFDRPLEDWLDLSTGVSPFTYPINAMPESVWNRLPEDDDGLVQAAQGYYQSPYLLPVAGSQAAIQILPSLLIPRLRDGDNFLRQVTVALPLVGYKEHLHAWQQAKKVFLRRHVELKIEFYQAEPEQSLLERCQVLVVINPNNPTADKYSPAQLLEWQKAMGENGFLVVDEAFMDMTPQDSLLSHFDQLLPDNIVVLRSLGKFFGLAGVRVGFLFASPILLGQAQYQLGPWNVAGPSRYIAMQALQDSEWQQQNRDNLRQQGERMAQLLGQYFSAPPRGHWLYYSVTVSNAKALHYALAQQGVLCRLCDEEDALRFGLVKHEREWQRLEQALKNVQEQL